MDQEKSDNSSPLPGTGAASQPGPTTSTPASQSAALATPAPHHLFMLPQRIDALLAEIQLKYTIADTTEQKFWDLIDAAEQSMRDALVSQDIKRATLKLINEGSQKLEALLKAKRVMDAVWTAFETEQSEQLQQAIEAATEEAQSSYLANRNAMGEALAEASQRYLQAYAGSPLFNVNASSAVLETSLQQARSQCPRTQEQEGRQGFM